MRVGNQQLTDPVATSRVYLDYQATTPVDPRVASVMVHAMTKAFGNPNSSEHALGQEAAAMIGTARQELACLVDAEPAAVWFTSGATQSIRLAIEHALCRQPDSARSQRVVALPVEHRAVIDVLSHHVRHGRASVDWVPVNRTGQIDLPALETLLAKPTDLVCVMAANNEIGTLYPVDVVGRLAADAGAPLLVDATQAVGKVPVRVREWGVTYLAMSAHKLYGPKGCGALVADPTADTAGFAATGTPNVPGIVGFGEACRLRRLEMTEDERRVATQRDRIQQMLRERIPDLVVNGDPHARLAGSLHVAVPGVPADAVLARLGDRLAISTGAACSSGAERSSHVLEAIGLTPELSEGALRFGLGKFTTDQDLEIAAELTTDAVTAIRAAMAA